MPPLERARVVVPMQNVLCLRQFRLVGDPDASGLMKLHELSSVLIHWSGV